MNVKNLQLIFSQTSGGLLACVPDENVPIVLQKLVSAGYEHASNIGHFFCTNRTTSCETCSVDGSLFETVIWLDY